MTTEAGGPADDRVELLRHTLATLAYRAAKTCRGAPEGFGEFSIFEGARTPGEVLAHMGDLMEWARSIAEGAPMWKDSDPLPWEEECDRFFAAVEALDARLAAEPPGRRPERIFQAPIADALTHTGQIALMRRVAGAPVLGENYYVAPIEIGRVGSEQGPPGLEFSGEASEA